MSRRWSSLLAARFGWTEVNLGLGGSLLTFLPGEPVVSGEARWREALGGSDPDIVLVMYGANDVNHGGTGVPLGSQTQEHAFLHAAHVVFQGIRATFPDATLVVLTPQPAAALTARRAAYDTALQQVAAASGALFVDAGVAFAPGAPYDADPLHLNDAGHAALAEYVATALVQLPATPAPTPAPAPAPTAQPRLRPRRRRRCRRMREHPPGPPARLSGGDSAGTVG